MPFWAEEQDEGILRNNHYFIIASLTPALHPQGAPRPKGEGVF
jgi:hypothetical protein